MNIDFDTLRYVLKHFKQVVLSARQLEIFFALLQFQIVFIICEGRKLMHYCVSSHSIGDDKSGRPVIVFSACRMPPIHCIDHTRLFR